MPYTNIRLTSEASAQVELLSDLHIHARHRVLNILLAVGLAAVEREPELYREHARAQLAHELASRRSKSRSPRP